MPASAVQSGPSFRTGAAKNYQAWVVKAAKQPMVLETVDLGPLGAEDVEVAVEHCGLCHSDLSVLNNDWGISQYPAILGHEVTGRITAIGPNTKGLAVGQRVGVGWFSGSDMHCRQCMSGNHHLCPQAQATIIGHRGGFATHIRAHWAWTIPLPEKLNPSAFCVATLNVAWVSMMFPFLTEKSLCLYTPTTFLSFSPTGFVHQYARATSAR